MRCRAIQPGAPEPKGHQAREAVETGLTRLPAGIGARIERLGPQLKESIKAFWAPGLLFEELDLAYIGVVDGHDVKALRPRVATGAEGQPADRRPHQDGQREGLRAGRGGRARGNGEVARGEARKSIGRVAARPTRRARRECARGPPQYTEVFGRALVDEARRDPRVIGITAAMAGGTGLSMLCEEVPDQYYDVGIAEQQPCCSRPAWPSRG